MRRNNLAKSIGVMASIMMGALTFTAQADTIDFSDVNIGDTVMLGKYEQDFDMKNGDEEIEWLVITKEDDKALLLSKYILEYKPANIEYNKTTWEDSLIRVWLNNDFYYAAFSDEERAQIICDEIENPQNMCGVYGGNTTIDSLFLLSEAEIRLYMPNEAERLAFPTRYAFANGVNVNEETGCCGWALRTPGYNSCYNSYIAQNGRLEDDKCALKVNDPQKIRPAFWISLKDVPSTNDADLEETTKAEAETVNMQGKDTDYCIDNGKPATCVFGEDGTLFIIYKQDNGSWMDEENHVYELEIGHVQRDDGMLLYYQDLNLSEK